MLRLLRDWKYKHGFNEMCSICVPVVENVSLGSFCLVDQRLGSYGNPMRINKYLLIDMLYDSAFFKNDFDFYYQNHTLY